MKPKTQIYLLLLAILCIASFTFVSARYNHRSAPSKPNASENQRVNVQYDASLFQAAIKQFPVPTLRATGTPYIAGIAPHHDLASPLMAEFYAHIASAMRVDHVILIGPNHPDVGSHNVVTAKLTWQVQAGDVRTDNALVDELTRTRTVQLDNDIVKTEHSIYTHIPFIQRYFPSATVVPLVIHSHTTQEQAQSLANWMRQVTDEHTIVIASVDFSHYMPDKQALEKDTETMRALTVNDYTTLARMQSDHLDSPKSIITLLSFVQSFSTTSRELLGHTTSADYLHHSVESSTSYYTIVWKLFGGMK